MKKMMKNTKGAYLVKTALLLPVLVLFWGWILSRAMMINFELDQQMAVDFAALSGAHYAAKHTHYEDNNVLLHDHMRWRIEQVLQSYGFSANTEPVIEKNDASTTAEITSTSPERDLFLIYNKTITKHASALYDGHTGTTRLLP